MRGSIVGQVSFLFQKSGLNQIGSSKHLAKEKARSIGARTWHDIGKNIGIFSRNTRDAYLQTWRSCLKFAKENFRIKDIEKLNSIHVSNFLNHQIEKGVSLATFRQNAAALEKLEVALNNYSAQKGAERSYDFTQALKEARLDARDLAKFTGSRAYKNPDAVKNNLDHVDHRLIASLQIEGGARINEVSFGFNDLKGIRTDPFTGREIGTLHIQEGKGGKEREINVSSQTYNQVAKIIAENGRYSPLNSEAARNFYRDAIKASCEKTGQEYHGSHGFRWNFAQSRFQEVAGTGLNYNSALCQVSLEMGHSRGDITEHYLR